MNSLFRQQSTMTSSGLVGVEMEIWVTWETEEAVFFNQVSGEGDVLMNRMWHGAEHKWVAVCKKHMFNVELLDIMGGWIRSVTWRRCWLWSSDCLGSVLACPECWQSAQTWACCFCLFASSPALAGIRVLGNPLEGGGGSPRPLL